MGVFILKKNEQMVQGFPVNRSYTKGEADAKFSGLSFETPTGTVDGVNTSFTVLHTPKFIVIDGASYFVNNGYTLSTLTITTTVPPTGFIQSAY